MSLQVDPQVALRPLAITCLKEPKIDTKFFKFFFQLNNPPLLTSQQEFDLMLILI